MQPKSSGDDSFAVRFDARVRRDYDFRVRWADFGGRANPLNRENTLLFALIAF